MIAAGFLVLPLRIPAPLQFEPLTQQVEPQKPNLTCSGKLGNLPGRCESWRRDESLCLYLCVNASLKVNLRVRLAEWGCRRQGVCVCVCSCSYARQKHSTQLPLRGQAARFRSTPPRWLPSCRSSSSLHLGASQGENHLAGGCGYGIQTLRRQMRRFFKIQGSASRRAFHRSAAQL